MLSARHCCAVYLPVDWALQLLPCHCLRLPSTLSLQLLGVREDDPCYADVFKEGIAYLLHAEHSSGDGGLWVPKTSSAYSRYHAAYTGVVGCMSHGACFGPRVPKVFLE